MFPKIENSKMLTICIVKLSRSKKSPAKIFPNFSHRRKLYLFPGFYILSGKLIVSMKRATGTFLTSRGTFWRPRALSVRIFGFIVWNSSEEAKCKKFGFSHDYNNYDAFLLKFRTVYTVLVSVRSKINVKMSVERNPAIFCPRLRAQNGGPACLRIIATSWVPLPVQTLDPPLFSDQSTHTGGIAKQPELPTETTLEAWLASVDIRGLIPPPPLINQICKLKGGISPPTPKSFLWPHTQILRPVK